MENKSEAEWRQMGERVYFWIFNHVTIIIEWVDIHMENKS